MSQYDDWYDNGPGSESFKQDTTRLANQAREGLFNANLRNAHLKKCLHALLEGLECQEIDDLMENGSVEMFRTIGKCIAIKARGAQCSKS